MLNSVKSGDINADIKQDTDKLAKESIINLIKIIIGETVPTYIPIDGILITIDNVDEYLK